MNLIDSIIALTYLLAASLFIYGIREMSSPATARRGNLLAAVGMFLAIAATLIDRQIVSYSWIMVGIVIGSLIGAVTAYKVKMTAMPQMVGAFNGFGGGASALVAIAEFLRLIGETDSLMRFDTSVTIMLSIIIGAVTFSGSFIAYGKLEGILSGAPMTFPGQKVINALVLISLVILSIYLVAVDHNMSLFYLLVGLSFLYGIMFVIPIGGADMPVVISLLNSFSGMAACTAGFVVENNILIIAGSLVGSAGLILTQIMCKAMNRSLANVLFSAFGTGDAGAGSIRSSGDKAVRSVDAEEAAMIMGYAQSAVIVPGYGMAAAQAQHAVRELTELLESRGVDVKFAIHPVAGRMPGHMNVLLAEAQLPYTLLHDMDDINVEFPHTDVALVIGANDVINPAARTDKSSPIYGMPILDVDKAKNIIIIKRSMNTGFAGIENELFYNPKTMMYFGGAREKVQELVSEVKKL
ncbi:MAG: NAD(P)(+) transhydrogenase (Re/Si-specific) subunit beta [Calditrichaeota bacterium]|nr:MAG: NAD(P)(+) transhydrogenase (Re/Si-specific) subunit beta [Calditrichota bacterium]